MDNINKIIIGVTTSLIIGGVVISQINLDTKTLEPINLVTNFAEIDKNGNVVQVIVASQSFIDSGAVGNPINWIISDEKTKKNNAGIGYIYEKNVDAFVPPKPIDAPATLDIKTEKWVYDKPQIDSLSATST